MISEVILYKHCKILKDKNFVLRNPVEGINPMSTYLSTLDKKIYSNFQFVKHALSISIKVDLNQLEFQQNQSYYDWNYVRIRNGADPFAYYFVDHFEWVSENTARIYLIMDTLNTFRYGRNYFLDKKTFVRRQHKDRFKDISSTTFTLKIEINKYLDGPFSQLYSNVLINDIDPETISISNVRIDTDNTTASNCQIMGYPYIIRMTNNSYIVLGVYGGIGKVTVLMDIVATNAILKEIDLKSEGIESPLYKISDNRVLDRYGEEDIEWKLYYRNQESEDDSVACFLVTSQPLNVNVLSSSLLLDPSSLPNDGYYIICVNYNDFTVDFFYNRVYVAPSMTSSGYTNVVLYKYNGTISVFTQKQSGVTQVFRSLTELFSYSRFESFSCYYTGATLPSYDTFIANSYYLPRYATTTITLTSTAVVKEIVDNIDRTLSSNIKLISLPYAPNNFYENEIGEVVIRDSWIYDNDKEMIRLESKNTEFKNTITSKVKSPYMDLVTSKSDLIEDIDKVRFVKDPKLLHSDFYRYKFLYDNFGKNFPLELLEFNPQDSGYLTFDFIPSRIITSKFLFHFFSLKWKYPTEDYENFLIAIRNNEEVLYSSQYLDYIRNGYNFDMKSKQRQEDAMKANLGLNAAALVASIALASTPVGAVGIFTSGVSFVNQLVNYAKTTAENESSIERKLQESRNQAIAVMNNDDLDLFRVYSGGNKAKVVEYKISERMEKVIDDLFYYGGYLVNEQMEPDISSRYWFNFCQADIVFNATDNISEECQNDIKERWAAGVTFLHMRNDTFNFEQDKENFEMTLLEEVINANTN